MKTNLISALIASTFVATAAQAGQMKSTPDFPLYSDAIVLKHTNAQWPHYIPTASFTRQGNVFTFDFDAGDGFSAGRGDMGNLPLAVGSLPPGTYTAHARVSDLANPSAPPQVTTSYFTVAAPFQPEANAIPASPKAYNRWSALVSSAYYVYPTSLRATVSGNVVSVSFEYEPSASTSGGSAPAGTAAYASLPMDGLAPGIYTLEFNGTPRGGSASSLQYRKDITVQRSSEVAEYYNDTTGHYFITGGPGEMAGLDAPGSGWRRTGESFSAWLSPADAMPGAVPVCRFYSPSMNSHFYTADAGECSNLKSIEATERAGGKTYQGWNYEGIAFHALVPSAGTCPGGTTPVYRFYNNRWRESDSNHRFPSTTGVANAMGYTSWAGEGIAFCSPA